MDEALQLFHAYGVPGIAALVFAKRMGVPVPALPLLLLAGARGAQDPAFALDVAAAASVVTVIADGLWFMAGQRFGRRMLALMCKLSIAPDTCIRKSELAFDRRGALTVLFAKFIPGVAGLAPPLAGALRMPVGKFTALNMAGTVAWVAAGVGLGWLLHRQVAQVIAAGYALGSLTIPVVVFALGAYLAWLAVRRARVAREARRMPKLSPELVAEKMARGEPLVFVDVRGPEAALQQRLPGAVHGFSEADLGERIAQVGHGAQLVVYCDCPNDVSAARVAGTLRRRGWPAHVLAGGFEAWRTAGLPLETSGAVAAR